MELMIKMSAAEADEAMTKGLLQALVYPFSCREEVRKAAEKPEEAKKEESKEVQAPVEEEPAEKKPVEEEQKVPEAEPAEKKPTKTEQKPTKTEQKATETEKSNYTLDQLSKAAADLITSDAGKQTALLELLHKFGIESMPELKSEDYQAFAEGLRALGGNL